MRAYRHMPRPQLGAFLILLAAGMVTNAVAFLLGVGLALTLGAP